MKQLTNEKMMTVAEAATAMGVSNDLVKKRIRELFAGKMEKGKTTYLNEKEVTMLKARIQENSSIATYDNRNRLQEMPKTRLEVLANYKNATQDIIELLEQEKAELEKQNALMLPKAEFYDKVTASDTSLTMNEVAKILYIGRNSLFSLLREENILMKNNLPYQKYAHHFEVREYPVLISGKTEVKTQTLVKQSGVDLIQRKLGGNK